MNAVRSRFGRKMDLVGHKRLTPEEGIQAIEPLNLRTCMRLPGFGNLVAQICPRWNRLEDWLREAEGYSRAA